ncbi:MAG TPA: methionine--tRNA ligase [Blastocatellia bacterium]|nr:methionine--tRNA ligase [Blastocatellia bacterium]
MGEKTFYVTTPIYYVNAKPHLGHAYTTLVVDTLTKFKRQRGVDSFFLTGTDEHGINIERAAEAKGIPLRQQVDLVVEEFKSAFNRLGIEYDRWIRTVDPHHEESVQQIWRLLDERGFIYKGNYEGWFCSYCNEFKDDAQTDEPVCPIHEKPLDRISEESYFFKLSAFQQPLLDLYKSRPEFVQPDVRRNEVISFVSGGLKDLSISRVSVKWGVPVPGDPSHTIYVWLDALTNYISALGWGNQRYQDFERYWPALHLVGKDILRFHAVYWPAFLMGAGVELPRTVFVHGMLLRGGQKMGKTLGNAIQLEVLHRYFTNDQIRYYLLREVAFGQDGEVTYQGLIDRANSDLADGLGNLASRTLTMIKNYFGGVPPRPGKEQDPDVADVTRQIADSKKRFDGEFDAYNFSRALEAAWAGIARVDKFITDKQPWKLAKEPSVRPQLENVLATAYEALRHLVLLVAPTLPVTSREIWDQMGLEGDPLRIDPNAVTWGEPIEVSRIDRISPAFPKLDKEKIMTEIENEAAAPAGGESRDPQTVSEKTAPPAIETPAPSTAPVITIDDFIKVELRAATVLEAEKVPKADKLLRLVIDVGEPQPRQILAGIAEHYAPEEVVGRKIIVVANLAPRKLRGLESNGMLLAASVGEDGRPVLATFGEDVPNGTRLK